MRTTLVAGIAAGALSLSGLTLAIAAETSQPAKAETKKITHTAADFRQAPRAVERATVPDRASRSPDRTVLDRNVVATGLERAEKRIEKRRLARIAARKARLAREAAARRAARERREERREAASLGGGYGLTGMAREVARCESGLDPNAQNPHSSASGLFQFIDGTWASVTGLAPPASAYSVETQTAAFWKLWNGGAGAGNWAPSQHCWG